MSDNLIAILAIAGKHSFTGAFDHRGVRVLDVLNDANTEFLEVSRAAVFRHSQREEIAQIEEMTLSKSAIDCVVLVGDTHEAQQRRQYAFVEKQPHRVFVVLNDHEIRGTIMSKVTPSPVTALSSASSPFFPLIQATITSIDRCEPISASVVLINRIKVTLMEIDKRRFYH